MNVNKRPVFEWFLAQGDVMITVTPPSHGLIIPKHLATKDKIDFILGDIPTPNISIDDDGVVAPMRFAGELFKCVFPWSAMLQMSGQDAVIYFRTDAAMERESQQERTNKVKKRSNLRLVKK